MCLVRMSHFHASRGGSGSHGDRYIYRTQQRHAKVRYTLTRLDIKWTHLTEKEQINKRVQGDIQSDRSC